MISNDFIRFDTALAVCYGDNLYWLAQIENKTVDLIYIDPPFNTGIKQIRDRKHKQGDTKIVDPSYGFDDKFSDYLGFLRPRLEHAKRVLRKNGSLFFHIDYRESHYCKIMLDEIFGRDRFMNEIIWAYDYGARFKKRWSCKHDTILWYVRDPNNYVFNYDEIDRIPYMSPELVGAEKASKGKTVTDVWWHTIVPTNSKEKTGYAAQKPLGILKRIVKVHSNRDSLLLDFFAGSGSFGEAALLHDRKCILIDSNKDAIRVMEDRFENYSVTWFGGDYVK